MASVETVAKDTSAADFLGPLLRRQVADLRAREAEVRLDQDRAVHQFRVAARRLRSSLAAFGSLLDGSASRALERQLREAAGMVGGVRDADVMRDRIELLLRGEPPSPEAEAVRARLADLLAESYDEGRQRAVDYLDSPAYDEFIRSLDRFVDLPPWSPVADASAEEALLPVLRREWTRLCDKGEQAQAADPGPERDERLHGARKAAKRVRYVAEADIPVLGRKARRLGKAAARVQQVLGEHQDSAITRSLLARAAAGPLGDSDVLGRMERAEAAAALDLYDEFVRVFREAEAKAPRKWISEGSPPAARR